MYLFNFSSIYSKTKLRRSDDRIPFYTDNEICWPEFYACPTSAGGQKTSQQLSLCVDQGSKVKTNLTIEDKAVVMGLREAFTSVLYNFRKNFNTNLPMWFQQMESYNLHLTSWVRVMVKKMLVQNTKTHELYGRTRP